MQVTIRVEQIKVWAYHGVYQEERVAGRYFVVDVAIKAELSEAALLTDDLSSTCNYEWIAEIVHREMKIPAALLEKKAIEMARAIQLSDERIKNVQLKLTKLQPPLKGEIGSTSVEISI